MSTSRLAPAAYVVARALRGMRQSPLVQLLAVGTMAVCMVLLGTAMLMWLNARGVADDWGVDVPLTVYMTEGAEEEQTLALARRLEQLPEVAEVHRIHPRVALERLQHGLGGQESLLDGVDADALPDSLEVHLHPNTEPEFGTALAGRLGEFPSIEDVAVLGPWAQQAHNLLATLRNLALGVGMLVSLACLAIVWSTIRLGVFARRDEIQILRLVGGTSRFVRGPFLCEGLLQGVLGVGLALVILYLGFDVARPHLEQGLSLVFAAGAIRFFGPLEVIGALALGGMLGVLGSRIAVARYVEA